MKTALWRQVGQILFALDALDRRKPQERIHRRLPAGDPQKQPIHRRRQTLIRSDMQLSIVPQLGVVIPFLISACECHRSQRQAGGRRYLTRPHQSLSVAEHPGTSIGYRRLRALEPGSWFRSVTPARYLQLYDEILSRLDPAEIYNRLIAFGEHPVLLCWESASDCQLGKTFCHRHLVAQWLEDRLGIEVLEIGHSNLDRFAFLRAYGIKSPDYQKPRTRST